MKTVTINVLNTSFTYQIMKYEDIKHLHLRYIGQTTTYNLYEDTMCENAFYACEILDERTLL